MLDVTTSRPYSLVPRSHKSFSCDGTARMLYLSNKGLFSFTSESQFCRADIDQLSLKQRLCRRPKCRAQNGLNGVVSFRYELN